MLSHCGQSHAISTNRRVRGVLQGTSGSIGSQNFFYTRQDGGGLCFGIKDDLHSKRLRGIADRGNFLSQESARGCILLAELFELILLFWGEGGTRLPLILSIRHGSISPRVRIQSPVQSPLGTASS